MRNYEAIVVGGGHAGAEAAHALCKRGHKTILFCMSKSHIGNLPCNPSLGGSAKGIVIKEIDALGGLMGRLADANSLQMKMLNLSKGPGVHAIRAQIDKVTYPKSLQDALAKEVNLTIEEGEVKRLLVEEGKVIGVILDGGEKIFSSVVILTTGTYLEADILRGSSREREGPDGDRASSGLSLDLQNHGIKMFRLKTGTPPRILAESIDYKKVSIQHGDEKPLAFSFDTLVKQSGKNIPCYLTYTNLKTHQIILDNLRSSAMYGGYVTGIGPRYCPSIEDKIVRFKDKDRHQLFLEPESLSTNSVYLQGFSTSMPIDIQDLMIHSLPGLEEAKILKYAYAIEYDAITPLQFDHSLAFRDIKGLFAAGQIIGTSGYEEAAALGLMAGINASCYLRKLAPFILKRHEAYIGVMIDDLVTKGTKEPYRLLSSRSEFRLLTRNDNALERLFNYGYLLGLNDEDRNKRYLKRRESKEHVKELLENLHVGKNQIIKKKLLDLDIHFNDLLSRSLADLIRARCISYEELRLAYEELPILDEDEQLSLVIEIQYEGYIKLQLKEVERLKKAEDFLIPLDFDYTLIKGISNEAKEKLIKIRPISIGEASRITNVHPSDISVLLLYIKTKYQPLE